MTAFSGTVTSDFEKLIALPEGKRSDFIDFTATDFDSLKSAFISYIKSVYPLDYTNFSESDLGMMLVELVAYMGSILSFKSDMLANENFLRTSKNRNNVRKLLELIGVKMKGPISSVAEGSLTLDSEPTGDIMINPDNRTLSITSPVDGAALNYTIYKVVNGRVDVANASGAIELLNSESTHATNQVYTNLALLEGAIVTMNGTFTIPQAVKRINLIEGPVIEKSVEIFVTTSESNASGTYVQVDNLFAASGATDRTFEVVYDDDYTATVVFGDGIVGISPPVGAEYMVTYRVGGGKRGNLPVNHINSIINVQDSAVSIQGTLKNTTMSTGGVDAETVAHAKRYAPLTFRRQDRLVTLFDYSTFVNSYVGALGTAAKGRAVTRNAFSSANTIDLYVLAKASDTQLQRATSAFKTDLLAAIDIKKMITDEVVIVDGLIRTLDLVVTIKIDRSNAVREETIKQRIKTKIQNYFNVNNFDFGKSLSLADLNRVMFEDADVRFSSIDNLDDNVRVDFNEIIQLNNLAISVDLV